MDTLIETGSAGREASQGVMTRRDRLRILIIDDEAMMRTLLRNGCEGAGYDVFEAEGPLAAEDELAKRRFDLVLLDAKLQGDSAAGFKLARLMRARYEFPIIMVTADAATEARISSLEDYADHYIVKPFDIRELIAVIRAVMRRAARSSEGGVEGGHAGEADVYEFGEWRLDASTRQLTYAGGLTVDLPPAEYELLLLFLRNPTRILSRARIALECDGIAVFDPKNRSVDMRVHRLRHALGQDGSPEAPEYIKTLRKNGYKVCIEVKSRRR